MTSEVNVVVYKEKDKESMVGNPSTLIDKKFQKVEKIERDSTSIQKEETNKIENNNSS